VVKFLINSGINVNAKDNIGFTAKSIAINSMPSGTANVFQSKFIEIIKILKEAGAK
jgi:ankyrin repeat protein